MPKNKSRKKKVVHLKGIPAKVHIGTRNAQIVVTIPMGKLRGALAKRD
jgi:hypothetical protein